MPTNPEPQADHQSPTWEENNKNLHVIYKALPLSTGVAFAWNAVVDYIRNLESTTRSLEAERADLRHMILIERERLQEMRAKVAQIVFRAEHKKDDGITTSVLFSNELLKELKALSTFPSLTPEGHE